MKTEDLLKCPLIEGLDAMHRAELLGLMNNSNVREKVERCLTNCARTTQTEQPSDTTANPSVDFQKEVHSWNPTQPIWRRSSKE